MMMGKLSGLDPRGLMERVGKNGIGVVDGVGWFEVCTHLYYLRRIVLF